MAASYALLVSCMLLKSVKKTFTLQCCWKLTAKNRNFLHSPWCMTTWKNDSFTVRHQRGCKNRTTEAKLSRTTDRQSRTSILHYITAVKVHIKLWQVDPNPAHAGFGVTNRSGLLTLNKNQMQIILYFPLLQRMILDKDSKADFFLVNCLRYALKDTNKNLCTDHEYTDILH